MVQVNIFESGNRSKGKFGLFKSKFRVITLIIGVALGLILRMYVMMAVSVFIFMFPVVIRLIGGIGRKKKREAVDRKYFTPNRRRR